MAVDQIANTFVDDCTHPSRGSCIKLKSFLLFSFACSNFDFFARNGAIDFICGRLLYGFGGECFLGRGDDGEGVAKKVLWMVPVRFERWFHLLKIIML